MTDMGWKAHSLGQALLVDASDDFMAGWLNRRREGRPTLVYAKPGTDLDKLAQSADRIDL
jgi:hypothetical protein